MKSYTHSTKRFCSVYKSLKKSEMYLYVDRSTKLTELPDALRSLFGTPQHVLDMILTPEKKLARTEASRVLEDIESNGFYLQLPPGKGEQLVGDCPAPKDTLHG
jgi:uncharacterized protein YcgL (UPF0745 family)